MLSEPRSARLISILQSPISGLICLLPWSMVLQEAAAGLGVSSSQLIKLLAKEPAALDKVNRLRASRGLQPLRNRK